MAKLKWFLEISSTSLVYIQRKVTMENPDLQTTRCLPINLYSKKGMVYVFISDSALLVYKFGFDMIDLLHI
jgi:hypothetical protein